MNYIMLKGHFSLSNRIVEYSEIIILVCKENAKFALLPPSYHQIISIEKSMSILKLMSSISKLIIFLTKHDLKITLQIVPAQIIPVKIPVKCTRKNSASYHDGFVFKEYSKGFQILRLKLFSSQNNLSF